MATKKKKRRKKTKIITFKALFSICAFLFACFIIIGSFLYLSNYLVTASPPLFEEIYSVSTDLNKKIGRIDHAIYESLYQRGIDERNVFFSTVSPRHEKGHDWDFTELLIKLPDREASFQLEKIIDVELDELRPDLIINKEKISEHEIVYHVHALDLYTHKIRLVSSGYEKIAGETLPKIAIIIDDIGYDYNLALSFMDYDLPLTLSVLPLAPYTSDIVDSANETGSELLLHLPMEPKDYPRLDPGPGALLTTMGEKELRRIISENIKKVPGLRGVNNHMGSFFTEKYDKMRTVLEEIKKHGLFYVDSRTTNRTIAFELAQKMGVPAAKKSVFLDNDLSGEAIRYQLERLMGMARYSGEAVGIGHPHRETLEILYEYLDKLKTDFRVVPVSELVR